MKFPAKKAKSTQYVIGGTVGVLILALWISLPLMSGSSMDGGVAAGNPFKSKVADLSALSDIPSEGGAPGSPLSGEMINNPATSGEDIASSLFQSGPEPETPAEASASADSASGSAPAVPSASGGAPSAGGPRGKLSAAASITGGNSNSMTAGGLHNKFFGSGAGKAEVAPALPGADLKKMAAKDNKSSLVAMLGSSADKSQLAAKSGKMDAAQNGASTAFGGSAKAAGSDLSNEFEGQSIESGLQLGQTAQDLKKSDPSLSKTKVTPPSKPEDATDESEEMKQQIKMMIIQMVLKAALGAMFGVAV